MTDNSTNQKMCFNCDGTGFVPSIYSKDFEKSEKSTPFPCPFCKSTGRIQSDTPRCDCSCHKDTSKMQLNGSVGCWCGAIGRKDYHNPEPLEPEPYIEQDIGQKYSVHSEPDTAIDDYLSTLVFKVGLKLNQEQLDESIAVTKQAINALTTEREKAAKIEAFDEVMSEHMVNSECFDHLKARIAELKGGGQS